MTIVAILFLIVCAGFLALVFWPRPNANDLPGWIRRGPDDHRHEMNRFRNMAMIAQREREQRLAAQPYLQPVRRSNGGPGRTVGLQCPCCQREWSSDDFAFVDAGLHWIKNWVCPHCYVDAPYNSEQIYWFKQHEVTK